MAAAKLRVTTQAKIFRCFAISFVIVETFSVIQGFTGGIRDWIPMFLMLFVSCLLYPKSVLSKEVYFLVLYILVLLVFASAGHSLANISWIANETLRPLTCLCIINVFLYNRDLYGLKIITMVGLILIGITSLLTIPILMKNPNAVRDMVMYKEQFSDTAFKYKQLGIASYPLIHSLPYLYPAIIYCIKTKKAVTNRLYYLVVLTVSYLMLLKSSVATPLILSTFGIVGALLVSKSHKRNIIYILLFSFFLVFTLNETIIVSSLKSIKPMFGDTLNAKKIDDILSSLKHDSAKGAVARIGATEKSFTTFIKSPLLGNMDKRQAGGHAYFLDRLAYFGLVGAMPLFLFFFFVFKRHFMIIDKGMRNYYFMGLALFVIMGIVKNVGGIETYLYLFVFLPGLSFNNITNT